MSKSLPPPPPNLERIRAQLALIQKALPHCDSGQDWRRVKSIENGEVAALVEEVEHWRALAQRDRIVAQSVLGDLDPLNPD